MMVSVASAGSAPRSRATCSLAQPASPIRLLCRSSCSRAGSTPDMGWASSADRPASPMPFSKSQSLCSAGSRRSGAARATMPASPMRLWPKRRMRSAGTARVVSAAASAAAPSGPSCGLLRPSRVSEGRPPRRRPAANWPTPSSPSPLSSITTSVPSLRRQRLAARSPSVLQWVGESGRPWKSPSSSCSASRRSAQLHGSPLGRV
mmetsp:Transcript_17436/g.43487  ORF Transcript_17436/g.43487 Transcript_17436/m.43487 type:complete len:205 (+) Transcript_17436:422-1036(+)